MKWLAIKYSDRMLDYEITPSQLAAILVGPEQKDVVLLDVREPEEYAVARIEGSILMPMGDVPSRANQELDQIRTLSPSAIMGYAR